MNGSGSYQSIGETSVKICQRFWLFIMCIFSSHCKMQIFQRFPYSGKAVFADIFTIFPIFTILVC